MDSVGERDPNYYRDDRGEKGEGREEVLECALKMRKKDTTGCAGGGKRASSQQQQLISIKNI